MDYCSKAVLVAPIWWIWTSHKWRYRVAKVKCSYNDATNTWEGKFNGFLSKRCIPIPKSHVTRNNNVSSSWRGVFFGVLSRKKACCLNLMTVPYPWLEIPIFIKVICPCYNNVASTWGGVPDGPLSIDFNIAPLNIYKILQLNPCSPLSNCSGAGGEF